MLKGEVWDYPTRIRVESEEEGDRASYLVDLCAFPRDGEDKFNGSCQCRDFIFRHEPVIRRNKAVIRRCKHILAAQKICYNFIIKKLHEADPNIHEDLQT